MTVSAESLRSWELRKVDHAINIASTAWMGQASFQPAPYSNKQSGHPCLTVLCLVLSKHFLLALCSLVGDDPLHVVFLESGGQGQGCCDLAG